MSSFWDLAKGLAYEIAIDVSFSALADACVSMLLRVNPSITAPQKARLQTMVVAALRRYRAGENIAQHVASICALAVPGAASRDVSSEILRMFGSDPASYQAHERNRTHVDDGSSGSSSSIWGSLFGGGDYVDAAMSDADEEEAAARHQTRAQQQQQQRQQQQRQQQQYDAMARAQRQRQQRQQQDDGSGGPASWLWWLFGGGGEEESRHGRGRDAEEEAIAERRERTRDLDLDEFQRQQQQRSASASAAAPAASAASAGAGARAGTGARAGAERVGGHWLSPSDVKLRDTLINNFSLAPRRIDAIPPPLRWPLLAALQSKPTCCISLEELVTPVSGSSDGGRVRQGVAVLFQRLLSPSEAAAAAAAAGEAPDQGGAERRAYHAYLYDKESLDEWFGASGRATNPATRDDVDVRSQCFQIS